MDQQLHAPKQQAGAAPTPQLRDGTVSAPNAQPGPRRSKKLIRAVKLLDVLTAGDQPLLDYLRENQAKCAQAVELAKEDMAEAETPEEAEELRPDPIDELVAGAPSMDLQTLRDMLLAQCRSDIAAELTALPTPPACLISLCGVPGCEIHEISPEGEVLRHIPSSESSADPTWMKCCRLLMQDRSIAYIEVSGDTLTPVR